MTDLEEYEKEYLKRHENQKKENSVTKTEEEKNEKKEVSKLLKLRKLNIAFYKDRFVSNKSDLGTTSM